MSIDKKPAASASRGYRWRYTIARRLVQLAILGLFIGTARLGWTLFGQPLLSGDFTSSLLLGLVPLSDPFAVLQKLFLLNCSVGPVHVRIRHRGKRAKQERGAGQVT